MRLHIVHRTQYRYSQPVSENFNEVRLQPVSDAVQECLSFELHVDPVARIRRYHDFHLNLVDHFYLAEPHEELVVESRSRVRTLPRLAGLEEPRFPLDRLDECRRLEQCYDFLQGSEFVSLDVAVWRIAHDVTAGATDAWQAALLLMHFIHAEFVYDARATETRTHMRDVLHLRRGVCQDFTHVFLGLCRSIRIPARYVSGYLYVGEGETLRGDLASHAWAEIFLPGLGWLALDPTNDQPADEHHVKVAIGRDYADAAPLRGNFRGRAQQRMSVDLAIRRMEA